MFTFWQNSQNGPVSARSGSGPLLELEFQMNELLARESGGTDAVALESLRRHRDEIRRVQRGEIIGKRYA